MDHRRHQTSGSDHIIVSHEGRERESMRAALLPEDEFELHYWLPADLCDIDPFTGEASSRRAVMWRVSVAEPLPVGLGCFRGLFRVCCGVRAGLAMCRHSREGRSSELLASWLNFGISTRSYRSRHLLEPNPEQHM